MSKVLYPPVLLGLFFAIVVTLSSCEQGNGVLVTQEFELESFNKINLIRHADIFITQGNEQQVTIEGESNLMDLITTDVVDGEWTIDFSKTVTEYETLTITIVMRDISSLRLTEGSGGDIKLETPVTSDNLNLELSGDGTISGEVGVTGRLTAALSGTGDMTLTGTTNEFEVRNTGAGTLKAFDLTANSGAVELTGSGNALVHYTGPWAATLTGSGNIRYKGEAPATIDDTGNGGVIAED